MINRQLNTINSKKTIEMQTILAKYIEKTPVFGLMTFRWQNNK